MSEAELKEYNLQLESVEAALKDDPTNPELLELQRELRDFIALTTDLLREQSGAQTSAPATPVTPTTATSTPRPPRPTDAEPAAPTTTYAVGDSVLARWASGDNQLYPAKIMSLLGSSANPIYLVKFAQYNVTEQLGPRDIKPNHASKKRKAEAAPASVQQGAVISQPAAIDKAAAEAARKGREGGLLDGEVPGKKKARKLEQKKVLDEGKRKWQEFAAKGVKGKAGRKVRIGESSMFRTPDSVHGRVGFTGSGQPMRKDAARGKHVYAHVEEEE